MKINLYAYPRLWGWLFTLVGIGSIIALYACYRTSTNIPTELLVVAPFFSLVGLATLIEPRIMTALSPEPYGSSVPVRFKYMAYGIAAVALVAALLVRSVIFKDWVDVKPKETTTTTVIR